MRLSPIRRTGPIKSPAMERRDTITRLWRAVNRARNSR